MADVVSVLEPNAQLFERALAKGMSDDLPVDIATILDPSVSPAEYLPFLAFHESVDLWYSDWAEARKREMVARSLELAKLKGTLPGLIEYLKFVDAEIIDRIASPQRFVLGRSALNRNPLTFEPFTARYLVKVELKRPKSAFILGRSAIGRGSLAPVDRTPIKRAENAGRVSKNEATQYTFNFAWRRRHKFGDGIPLDGSHKVGQFVDRETL